MPAGAVTGDLPRGSRGAERGEGGGRSRGGMAMLEGSGKLLRRSAGQAAPLGAPPGSTLGVNFPADYTRFQREGEGRRRLKWSQPLALCL